jgi:Fuc2NAc and GlcNAc transferase
MFLRGIAVRRALFDAPNERSLHRSPTPRLGGVAIATSALLALCVQAVLSASSEWVWLSAIGAALAGVGLVDDLRSLPAAPRLALHVVAGVAVVRGLAPNVVYLTPGYSPSVPATIVAIAIIVWVVGVLNIYNFMDGMDGLAGSQAIFAALVYAWWFAIVGAPTIALLCATLVAATSGFLMHNFPPARIFMGDAGSTFIGFCLASLAVVGMRYGMAMATVALPIAPFLLDATFTLCRRVHRREAIWKAHRSHLYQRAVQTGLGHRDVLLVYLAWMAVAAMTSFAAFSSTIACVVGWLMNVAVFLAVWRWVVWRESQQSLTA